jgi:hypothetical protein
MTQFRRAWELSSRERRLVINAGLLCAAIRVGLFLLRLQTLRRVLHRISNASGAQRNPDGLSPEQISRAVAAASRFVPGSTCLTRALAVAVLLERRQYPATLRIGFARTPDHGFQGHAWAIGPFSRKDRESCVADISRSPQNFAKVGRVWTSQ